MSNAKLRTVTSDIKADLKKAFPNTKFSVKKGTGGLETQYKIEYTNGPAASLVEKLTKKYEVVRRCTASNEILSGCNTFISIDRILTDEAKAVYKDAMETLGFTDHRPHCNHAMYAYNKTLKAVMETVTL